MQIYVANKEFTHNANIAGALAGVSLHVIVGDNLLFDGANTMFLFRSNVKIATIPVNNSDLTAMVAAGIITTTTANLNQQGFDATTNREIAPALQLGTAANAPTITTGTGVPSGTPNNGSLYLRVDGTISTTLYVANGSTWTAVTIP